MEVRHRRAALIHCRFEEPGIAHFWACARGGDGLIYQHLFMIYSRSRKRMGERSAGANILCERFPRETGAARARSFMTITASQHSITGGASFA